MYEIFFSEMYEMIFFCFLLGVVDALSVCIFVLISALLWGGALLEESETVFDRGSLFKENASDRMFNSLSSITNRFTDTLWIVFGLHCLSAIIIIFYLTSNAETLIYSENWPYILVLGIVLIILNGIFTFIIPITSRWSVPLATIALIVKVALSVFAGYNYYIGFILFPENLSACNTLSIIGIFLWALVFIICCVFPIASRGKGFPIKVTPRAYLFPFLYFYKNIGRRKSILLMIIFLGLLVLITVIIGIITKRSITNQEINPYSVLWITVLGVIILFIIKDMISFLITKVISSRVFH